MSLFAFVGCYTTPERGGQGKGINVYRVDRRTGTFQHVQLLGGLENPSFLAIDKTGRFLYSVHGDRSAVPGPTRMAAVDAIQSGLDDEAGEAGRQPLYLARVALLKARDEAAGRR